MRRIIVMGSAAIVLGLAAITSGPGTALLGATNHTSPHMVHVDGSLADGFASWGKLKGASTLIVVGTAGAQQTTVNSYGEPWTATTVQVDRALKGAGTGPQTVLIRQIGGAASNGVWNMEGFPLLTPGSRYLLFLTPSPVSGQFYPVGGPQGAFPVSATGAASSYSEDAATVGMSLHGRAIDQVIQDIQDAPDMAARP